ncbi:MAG: hypothetical protein SNJ64_01565 [Endomicrobiia bacterium]
MKCNGCIFAKFHKGSQNGCEIGFVEKVKDKVLVDGFYEFFRNCRFKRNIEWLHKNDRSKIFEETRLKFRFILIVNDTLEKLIEITPKIFSLNDDTVKGFHFIFENPYSAICKSFEQFLRKNYNERPWQTTRLFDNSSFLKGIDVALNKAREPFYARSFLNQGDIDINAFEEMERIVNQEFEPILILKRKNIDIIDMNAYRMLGNHEIPLSVFNVEEEGTIDDCVKKIEFLAKLQNCEYFIK